MKRTRYVVYYGADIARFSSYYDAIIYARSKNYAEVADRTGIIAQFRYGEATEEFAHLDKDAA